MKGKKNKKKRTGQETLLRETADKGDWPESYQVSSRQGAEWY